MTGNENHSITLTEASAMTKRYRDTITSGDTIALCFGKSDIQSLLNQTSCVGVRLYYALNEASQDQLVAVGVNSDGNDLYEGILLDRSVPCPQMCSAANPLNTNPIS